MKIIQTYTCTFCGNDVESIEHHFVDCYISKQLWGRVAAFLRNRTGVEIHLSKSDKVFGAKIKDDAINYIITLVKEHIYYKKVRNSKPSIEEFKVYMKEVLDRDHYLARLQEKKNVLRIVKI